MFTALILVLVSIKNIAHDEYALQYHRYHKKLVDEPPLEEGREMTNVYVKLFKYPAKNELINIDNLTCQTYNGITIKINSEVTFTLSKDKLIYIFENFGKYKAYKQHIHKSIVTELRNSCTEFQATDFPNIRSTIEQTMESKLKTFFENDGSVVLVTRVQLKNYSFPSSLNNAITNKQKALQGIDNALNKRKGEITKAETRYGTALIQAETIDIQADVEKQKILNEANAEANGIQALWDNRKTVYKLNKDAFGQTADEFVESYLKGSVLRNAKNPIISV